MIIGKRLFAFFIVGLILTGLGSATEAQTSHLTAKSIALGGGGTAYVDGYQANFVNPANLMLGKKVEPRITVGILGGVSLIGGGPLADVQLYNKYFTHGLTIDGKIADEILHKWFGDNPTGMKRLGMQVDGVPLGASYRGKKWAISLAFRLRVLANASMNKGLAQLYLEGFTDNYFSSGKQVNFSAQFLSFYEVSVGFAYKVMNIDNIGFAKNVKLYVGAAPKLLLGANTTQIDFRSVLTLKGKDQNGIDEIIHDFEYTIKTSGIISDQLKEFYRDRMQQQTTPHIGDYIDPEAENYYSINAIGVGIDLGVTAEMDLKTGGHLTAGLSLTDIGKLTFKNKVGRFYADNILHWKGFKFNQQVIDNKYNGDRQDYINHVLKDSIATNIYGSFSPQGASKLTRHLPARLNLGFQYRLNKLSVSLDLTRGFSNQGINSKRLAMSVGVQYELLGFLPLRAGIRVGGYSSTSYSAGFGLVFKHFEFNVGVTTAANTSNRGTNIGAAWSGLIFKF